MNMSTLFQIAVAAGIVTIIWRSSGILAELRQLTRKGGSALDELERLEDRWAGAALPDKLDDPADMADDIIVTAGRRKAEEENAS